TITGTNDAPVLSVDTDGAVTEDAATPDLTDSGVLSFSDVDTSNLHNVSVSDNADAVWSGGALSPAQISALTSGFTADSNSWDYTVANAATQFLALGETVTFSYDVTVTDNDGGSDTATVTVVITGSNDAPTVTGLVITESSISFTANDVDVSDALTLAGPFAAAFGNPPVNNGTTTTLTPTQQAGGVSGTLQVTDGSTTAAVVGLYLGTSAGDTAFAPLAGSPNAMYGFGGADTLTGGTAADSIFGGADGDTLTGGGGADNVFGGTGNDRITMLVTTGDVDTIDAGSDNDTLLLNGTVPGSGVVVADLSAADQIVSIGGVADVLAQSNFENLDASGLGSSLTATGSAVANIIVGSNGNDTINGGDGADSLYGGAGNDALTDSEAVQSQVTTLTFNASGYDTGDVVSITVDGVIYSHTVLSTGRTAEQVYDALKAVSVSGVTLANSLAAKGVSWAADLSSNAVTLTSNPGAANAFTITTGTNNGADVGVPWIYTVDFNDSVGSFFGAAGTENITITIAGTPYVGTYATNTFNSNTNFDNAAADVVADINAVLGAGTATYNTSNNTFTITMPSSVVINATSTSDDTSGSVVNTQVGSAAADQPSPSVTTSQVAAGSASNDTLAGGDGNDTITAGAGDDSLFGGNDDDVLTGGAGADVIDGGAGSDTASYTGSAAAVTVNLTTGTGSGGDAQGDTLAAIENLIGSAFGDTLTGNAGANTISGGAGNDTIEGGYGADSIDGGTDNDVLTDTEVVQGQVTTLTFNAGGYDTGDVVSITVDGVTYSHTVLSTGRTAEQVYDALKAVSVSGVTLANSLAAKGVSWAANLSSNTVTLTSNPGAANAFTITTVTNNGSDVLTPWVYRVDFSNPGDFDTNDIIRITINGTIYSSDGSNSGGNDTSRFDDAQASLLAVLTGAGFTATNNTSNDTFDITINTSATISGAVIVDGSTVQSPSAAVVTSGSLPTDQPSPSVTTSQVATDASNDILAGGDGNDTITAGAGDDSLFGGDGSDVLTGGAGADSLDGGSGIDTFTFNAGDTTVTIGGSGDNGTISGYDVINGFVTGGSGDILDLPVVEAAADTGDVNGTDTSLTIGGDTVEGHNVTNGIVTFYGDDSADSQLLALTSAGNLAAAMQYLLASDIGGAGSTIAFTTSGGFGTHSFVYQQTTTNSGNSGGYTLVQLSGVTLTNISQANVAPAGIAGEPINLALSNPADHVGLITVNIVGVPAGWGISEGTDNGDGTWSVQTDDVTALTITTTDDFSGAVSLQMSQTWTDASGDTGLVMITNNVEAYAPGSPIFALSQDDNLSGSSGADTFVFAQPIAHNQVYGFDVAADRLDLIGFGTGLDFASLQIADDGQGNAVITLGPDSSITLRGVDAGALGAANFVFDLAPEMSNSGTMMLHDGAMLPLGGFLDNSGSVLLDSHGQTTRLEVLVEHLTLRGGGQVVLSDSPTNLIVGSTPQSRLVNENNTISGAGQLGGGQLMLANAGLILANGLHALLLDTGNNVIDNSGTLAATGPGGMTVASALDNSGHLWANGGDLRLLGDVTGGGSATIDGDGTLAFGGAARLGSVAFHGDGAGTLAVEADDAMSLGTILGLEQEDGLLLSDLIFGVDTRLSYSASTDGTGGLLTVSDGTQSAALRLLGHYSEGDFLLTGEADGSVKVGYGGAASGTLVGTMEDDDLQGGAGNNILVGRAGSDLLHGGSGADTFAWLQGDLEAGKVTLDYVADFNQGEGDRLDLSDLLDQDGSQTMDSLKSLLSMVQETDGIHLQVQDTTTHQVAQDIVLMNHSFGSLTGDASSTASQVIDYLLSNHRLDIDNP
ncbi:hypothetical protein CF121_09745, partial [Aeromonas media]